jgi:hypothetical protein
VYTNRLAASHEELSARLLNGLRNDGSKVLAICVLVLHGIFRNDRILFSSSKVSYPRRFPNTSSCLLVRSSYLRSTAGKTSCAGSLEGPHTATRWLPSRPPAHRFDCIVGSTDGNHRPRAYGHSDPKASVDRLTRCSRPYVEAPAPSICFALAFAFSAGSWGTTVRIRTISSAGVSGWPRRGT